MSTTATKTATPKSKTTKASKNQAPEVKAFKTSTKVKADKSIDLISIKTAANTLKMIADSTRIRLLTELVDGPRSVGDLCEIVGHSQPSISHNLAMLRHSRIVEGTRDGKFIHYALTAHGTMLVNLIESVVACSA